MPSRILLFILVVGLGVRLSAASMLVTSPSGATRVAQVQAVRQDDDQVVDRIEAQYRASYYYAIALLAAAGGDHASAALLLGRAQSADPDSALLRAELGQELEADGQDAKAGVLLKAALDADPNDLELRRRLSRLYLRLNKAGDARALFLNRDGSDPDNMDWLRTLIGMDFVQDDLVQAEKRLRVLMAHGGDAEDRELLAVTLQRQEHWKEAAQEYRTVLKALPSRTTAWARLSACDEAAGDTPLAKVDLQQGLAQEPKSGLLADLMGKLQYRTGDFAGAEASFSGLVDKDPSDARSLLYRGLSRLKGRKYSAAEDDFVAVGKLDKDDPSQRYALALALIMQKKYAPAEDALKTVLALNPQADPAWIQLAFLYERQKQPAKAVDALRQGLKANPKSDELCLLLSSGLEDQGDRKGAIQVLHDGVARGAGDAVRFQLAVLYDKDGKFSQAETELQALVVASPQNAQALNYLGYSWADRGQRLGEAEQLIRRALAVDPGNHYYQDSLGWALHKEGRSQEALEQLNLAAAKVKDPADAEEAEVFDHLAAVQASLGHTADAAAAKARAEAIRKAAKERAAQEPEPAKEPDL